MGIGMVVVGVALLGVIATVVGLLQREERIFRDGTLREIAQERRRLWEEQQRLEALVAELEACRRCPLRPGAERTPQQRRG
jgi:hypothetical protein